MAGAALVGAAVGYGVQVYNNYQNGYTGSDAWTENISATPIVGGLIIGATVAAAAPIAVAAAGDILVGAGVATSSTTLFGAGMTAYGTASTMQHFYKYGTTLPVYHVNSQKFPTISSHIRDAQRSGQPSVLTRTTNQNLIKQNRASATKGVSGLDEYPFASTYEGGKGASVRPVNWAEHKYQGPDIRKFYRNYNILDRDKFKVIVD
jgi:hypothetical protein